MVFALMDGKDTSVDLAKTDTVDTSALIRIQREGLDTCHGLRHFDGIDGRWFAVTGVENVAGDNFRRRLDTHRGVSYLTSVSNLRHMKISVT